jgi:hypothetical protein
LGVLDAATIRRWADLSVDRLDDHRADLDRINVFPVPDGDTGTNLALTVRAAAEALARAGAGGTAADAAAALASGALRGARGNSGVIVSQVFRGFADALADPELSDPVDTLASALARADDLARAAISRPVEGTILTVLRAAASAAGAVVSAGVGVATPAAQTGRTLPEVATLVARAASEALANTPRDLPVLARAGVVDAGGRGLVLLLDALAEIVSGLPIDRGRQGGGTLNLPTARDRAVLSQTRETGSPEFDYEVMYLLEDATPGRVDWLRERLDELGDSVVVVGDRDESLWHVHVHCTDVGAALEAGIAAGRPHRITVIRFADQRAELGDSVADQFRLGRAVVAVVPGEQVAELVRAEAVTALVAPPGVTVSTNRLVAAVRGSGARHVVVLPNDIELTPVAEEAAELVRDTGQEVVVIPTSSALQGLAALAVHDPKRRAGADVVAMAEAAAATRTGEVRVATEEALTWAGRCQAGDILGMVDGEVVLIGQALDEAARRLVDRMLTVGGELVTILTGAEADLGPMLEEYLRRGHPEVEVALYEGGPDGPPLRVGVE